MEDAVDKADAWALVRVLVWEFDMDLPVTASEGGCTGQQATRGEKKQQTYFLQVP